MIIQAGTMPPKNAYEAALVVSSYMKANQESQIDGMLDSFGFNSPEWKEAIRMGAKMLVDGDPQVRSETNNGRLRSNSHEVKRNEGSPEQR